MRLTRREALVGAGAAVLGGGIYELVDRLASTPPARALAEKLPPEQHVLESVRVVRDNGVEVLVPPLHHEVVTATVRARDLKSAQHELEEVLTALDRAYQPTPAGLGFTVAWGLPYFRRHVAKPAKRYLPRDLRAKKGALLDARRFPSDPGETVLEQNEVAVLLRSDRLDHIKDAHRKLFSDLELFRVTSIRRGFAGGGFDGKRSLPKQMALAAGIPGADLIPETAELFLGFTSTQRANLGPARIANFETLGFVLTPEGYFRGGTHMHLSHIEEDLEAWYLNFSFREQVDTVFRPGLKVKRGIQTVRQGAQDVATERQLVQDFHRRGRIGHSQAIQPASRLQADRLGEDGTLYKKGTAIPQRADFNTLDNPFAFPVESGAGPTAGVHFVVFNPTSDDFERGRLAMDGNLPGGTKLRFQPRSRGQGINSVLRTTHRQNFLVPPRAHRSFPLAELL
ncbi:MAG TPA: hypothetical protein VGJ25_05545 [Gaiellaceae bacterium]